MLTRPAARPGFTLIEMMIALAIVASVLAVGMPSFATWLKNIQIRNAAESIKNGLVFAQTEAMRRNTPIRFQLTSSIDATCALSTTKPNWVVNVGDASSNDPSGSCGAPNESQTPFIIKSVPAAEGMRSVVLDADQSTIVFNGLGQATNVTGTIAIEVTNPNAGTCATSTGGTLACLRVVVSRVGQVRLCNPNITRATAGIGC